MTNNTLTMLSLADELETYISDTIPKAETVKKYGGTLFTLKPEEKEGQFCGVFVLKQHVQVSFSNGAELKDPKGLLTGTGKKRRHVNYTSSEDVNFPELKKLLKQSAKLSS